MNKSVIYEKVIEYAKANNIKFAFVKNDEICPEMDLNGFCFLDTDTFEIPCAFAVDNAIILCIDTPVDMTPEDTGESYDKYWDVITDLNRIGKPQYVALNGAYIKLMCWCDWMDEENPKRDFFEACEEAIKETKNEDWYHGEPLDFRLTIEGCSTLGLTFTTNEIGNMWECVKNLVDWDCEIYVNYSNINTAETTDHGIKSHMNSGIRIIKAY